MWTTSEKLYKGKKDYQSVAEETISKSILCVGGDAKTAGYMSRTVNQDEEDKGIFANLLITSNNVILIIEEYEDAVDESVKKVVHIDTRFPEQKHNERIHKAFEDMCMDLRHFVSSQAQ